ncbi:hypothetical protein HDU76_004191 [Blyttiomyces sp. JEL0837]|nr:hypothetical protein HDU76_004191 [Blyttiomyces sp. JEL0837]
MNIDPVIESPPPVPSTSASVIASSQQQSLSAVNDGNSSQRLTTDSPFSELDITNESKMGIKDMGFEFLTPVQLQSLPVAMEGNDVLAKAKTGTGKTMAFLLPSIERIARNKRTGKKITGLQLLIISPTRELASQILTQAQKLCKYHNISVALTVGGTNMNAEQKRLFPVPTGVDIVVATPGRLLDHVEKTKGFVEQFKYVDVLVLDEADQLLEQGFQPAILKIIGFLSKKENRQTLLFSATVPNSLRQIVHVAMKDSHVFVDTVGHDTPQTNEQVEQRSAIIPFQSHLLALDYVIRDHMNEFPTDYKIIIFFTTARVAGFCAQVFEKLGYPVLEMHSRKSQGHRNQVANKFRQVGVPMIMFSSDVSDYPDVSLIIQVGLTTREQYIHRVGRTGRAGRLGKAIILLSPFEQTLLRSLSKFPITDVSESIMSGITAGGPEIANFKKVIVNVKRDDGLKLAAEQAYQAFLGFYNGNTKTCGFSKLKLVEVANWYASIIGLDYVPVLERKTVGKMGLTGVPGLRT